MRIMPVCTSQNAISCKKKTSFGISPRQMGASIAEIEDYALKNLKMEILEETRMLKTVLLADLKAKGDRSAADFIEGLHTAPKAAKISMSEEDTTTLIDLE